VYFRVYFDGDTGRPPETIWPHSEVGSNRTSKKEIKDLFGSDVFATPKPEALIQRVLSIATDPGDIVLDSFAGSGTTGAVAHKMGRRWIMIELGDHCRTHIVPRLTKVIDGADAGGITETVGWGGGGGFRFYRLAPSLIEHDRFGQPVISSKYDANMLPAAMCKHMGFTYAPSQDPREYWKHGHSSERDFIFVTTASLTYEALKALSEAVGDERTLLICCKAFRAKADAFANLTIKKIPQSVLNNCEWGRDDYSLKIAQLPEADRDDEPSPGGTNGGNEPSTRPRGRRNGRAEPRIEAAAKTATAANGRARKRKIEVNPAVGASKSPTKARTATPPGNSAAAKAKGRKKVSHGKGAAFSRSRNRRREDDRQGRLL
jgi:adenine-specific DNA-methyltransferase